MLVLSSLLYNSKQVRLKVYVNEYFVMDLSINIRKYSNKLDCVHRQQEVRPAGMASIMGGDERANQEGARYLRTGSCGHVT